MCHYAQQFIFASMSIMYMYVCRIQYRKWKLCVFSFCYFDGMFNFCQILVWVYEVANNRVGAVLRNIL